MTVTVPGPMAAPCDAGASARPVFMRSAIGTPLMIASTMPRRHPIPAQSATPRRMKTGSSSVPAMP